ncbi:MAG: hypothetical protein EZS28_003932 [Streblomastix strix]|uniref:Uncharacterized protein n=1 Tax=Streblomastix strix TaxID=222440 RepID=A0A5J4WZJ0_9EUKA|nr:MAG: hypothetical protein EZS28_003932 [Streblomastix strix]
MLDLKQPNFGKLLAFDIVELNENTIKQEIQKSAEQPNQDKGINQTQQNITKHSTPLRIIFGLLSLLCAAGMEQNTLLEAISSQLDVVPYAIQRIFGIMSENNENKINQQVKQLKRTVNHLLIQSIIQFLSELHSLLLAFPPLSQYKQQKLKNGSYKLQLQYPSQQTKYFLPQNAKHPAILLGSIVVEQESVLQKKETILQKAENTVVGQALKKLVDESSFHLIGKQLFWKAQSLVELFSKLSI